MKKILLYITVLLAALSCREKAEYDQTLGLLSRYNVLSVDGGSTQVAVFSNTAWTVELDHPASWVNIDRFEGYKTGYLVFDYAVNYGRSRRVDLVFKAGDQTRRLTMYQAKRLSDGDCTLSFSGASSVPAAAAGETISLTVTTNLLYSLEDMSIELSYPEGQTPETPWITLLGFEQNPLDLSDIKVNVQIAPNETGATRQGYIQLTHTDGGPDYQTPEGSVFRSTNKITVVQLK